MKKTSILLFLTAATLTSCGIVAQSVATDDGQRFQDGIYNSSPSLKTRAEKTADNLQKESLINKTKASHIYLFGDKKDTILIPENMSAKIQFDQTSASTTVTIGEAPYGWWNGYVYTPYSIGSPWYWSRHYSPYYSPYWGTWGYCPWRYYGYYDAWYYNGFYDPWYGGFYDPWYYSGYWGWHDPWHHHHHHHHMPGPGIKPGHSGKPGGGNTWHGLRADTQSGNISTSRPESRTSTRRGFSSSSKTSRVSTTSRTSAAPVYRRPASSTTSSSVSASPSGSKSSGYTRRSSTMTNDDQPSYKSNYSRGSSSGGYSRSSSSGSSYTRPSSSGGGFSRSSSSSYRR